MVSDRLQKIILNVLNLDRFDFKDKTAANEVPGWDSFSHINIIMAIEKEYNIHFKGIEVLKVKNMEDLQKLIDSKC